MKKYIFITTICILLLFSSCSSSHCDTSSKCDSIGLSVRTIQRSENKRYDIVTYEDSVRNKRYTIFVCTAIYGCGCTLIDTEEIK